MKTTIPKVPFEGFEQDNDHDRAEFFRQKNKEHFGGLMECAKEAQTMKTERDAALARAEAAEAEIRAIREEVRADPAAKTVDAVAALFASARCTVEDAQREAERLRHGVPIEGDLVCPNELRATEAEAELARARPLIDAAEAYARLLKEPDTLEAYNAEEQAQVALMSAAAALGEVNHG